MNKIIFQNYKKKLSTIKLKKCARTRLWKYASDKFRANPEYIKHKKVLIIKKEQKENYIPQCSFSFLSIPKT
jgi:hypothetical protein